MKARINQNTDVDLSVDNLAKRIALHKIDHGTFDPHFLQESERAGIIAVLSSN